MPDLKDLAEGAGTRAALQAGKDMAKRAIDDLTLTDEEKAKRTEEQKASRKKLLIKVGVVGVVGVVAFLSLMSVLAKLWIYALGLLVVLGIGAGGYFYVKPKVIALKQKATARLMAKNAEKALADAEQAKVNAVVAKEKKLEDELAALRRKAGG